MNVPAASCAVEPSYPDALLGLAIYHRQKGDGEEARA